jgi:hypothetical protein
MKEKINEKSSIVFEYWTFGGHIFAIFISIFFAAAVYPTKSVLQTIFIAAGCYFLMGLWG